MYHIICHNLKLIIQVKKGFILNKDKQVIITDKDLETFIRYLLKIDNYVIVTVGTITHDKLRFDTYKDFKMVKMK